MFAIVNNKQGRKIEVSPLWCMTVRFPFSQLRQCKTSRDAVVTA